MRAPDLAVSVSIRTGMRESRAFGPISGAIWTRGDTRSRRLFRGQVAAASTGRLVEVAAQ